MLNYELLLKQLDLAEAYIFERAKHLPGQHDQSSHGGGGNKQPEQRIKRRVFDNTNDRQEFAIRHSSKVADSLSTEESRTLNDYRSAEYWEINNTLRREKPLDADLKDTVIQLDSVIERSELSESVTVFRGISGDVLPEEKMTGSTFSDKGFVSTSLDEEFARDIGYVLMEIRLNKGDHGFAYQPVYKHDPEFEVLLSRNITFKVISDNWDPKLMALNKYGVPKTKRILVLEIER